jgi:hypothetical protein
VERSGYGQLSGHPTAWQFSFGSSTSEVALFTTMKEWVTIVVVVVVNPLFGGRSTNRMALGDQSANTKIETYEMPLFTPQFSSSLCDSGRKERSCCQSFWWIFSFQWMKRAHIVCALGLGVAAMMIIVFVVWRHAVVDTLKEKKHKRPTDYRAVSGKTFFPASEIFV